MSSYLDKTGLTYLWGKIKSVFAQKGDAVKNIERNGTTFTATKADGTTFTFDQQDTTEATKLKNAKTFNVSGNATGTAQQFDGTQNVSIPITSYNTQGLTRPAAIRGVSDNTLQALFNATRANRLAFLPADQIIIEKTVDGGLTWTDAGISDANKLALFSEVRPNIFLPLLGGVRSPLCGIRITFTAMKYNVPEGTVETAKYNYWNSANVLSTERYNQLKDFYFWVSVSDGTLKLKIEGATGADSTNWVVLFNDPSFYLSGWSGSDYARITQVLFGGSTGQVSNRYWNFRMTFMSGGKNGTDDFDTANKTGAQAILEIRGYGDSYWTKGNEYAATDKIYTHDANKNVTFPAKVTATSFAGATATSSANGLMSSSDKSKLDALPTSASLVASLNTKVDKVDGKGLSSNDFTSEHKDKLEALPGNDTLPELYAGKMYQVKSGPLVSFSDGADGKPINELSVAIEPVQDLHGYDHPWPAGGGKNLWNPELYVASGSSNTVTRNGDIYTMTWVNGALCFHTIDKQIFQPGEYTISFIGTNIENTYIYIYDSETGDLIAQGIGSKTIVSSAPFYIGVGGKYNNPGTAEFRIQLEEGSVATAYAPYSNICPITGWTGAKVTRTGKNLIPKAYDFVSGTTKSGVTATINDDGSIHVVSAGTGAGSVYFNLNKQATPNIVLPAGTYCLSGSISDKVYVTGKNAKTNVGLGTLITLTEATGLFLYLSCTSSVAYDVVVYPQLEAAPATTPFEPYTGEVFNITFPSEAGTVYGGTLDVTNGVLTVNRAMVDLGTLYWAWYSQYKFYLASLTGRKAQIYGMICSVYKNAPGSWTGDDPTDNIIWGNESNANIYIQTTTTYESAAAFKTAMSGVQLVYELATPVTYQLTPQQITTLLGKNTVWADCGDILNLEYVNESGWNLLDSIKPATESADGLMSSSDKSKLNGLPTSASLTASLNTKVDKETGKGLSENDYTTEEKTKLGALPTNASLVASLNTKVDKETGKGLSSNDFTSAYKGKLDGLDDAYEGKMYFSQSGPVVSFDDGAEGKPVSELRIGINPVQSGSGTPSLSNPRPITGWTGVNVHVSPTTDAADGQTFPITFPSEVGTVYSGVLDLTAGTLTVDRIMFSRNTSTMNNNETYPGWKNAGIKQYGAVNGSIYNNATMNIGATYSTNVNNDVVFLSTSVYGKNQTQWKALAVDVQILILLTAPITYQLTPAQILMLAGANNVWADCGDILNLEHTNASGWKLLKGAENKPATASKAGLMSAEDKEKLDSITPLRMNNGVLEYFDGSAWTAVPLGQ